MLFSCILIEIIEPFGTSFIFCPIFNINCEHILFRFRNILKTNRIRTLIQSKFSTNRFHRFTMFFEKLFRLFIQSFAIRIGRCNTQIVDVYFFKKYFIRIWRKRKRNRFNIPKNLSCHVCLSIRPNRPTLITERTVPSTISHCSLKSISFGLREDMLK